MKQLVLAMALLALSFLGGTAHAEPPADAKAVIKHLEFLGYQVSTGKDTIDAQHDNYLNISLEQYQGGMLLSAYFKGTAYSKKNPKDFLTLINKLNQKASAVRYYIDKDGDMILEGYYPGGYDKKTFNLMLDVFNLERSNLGEFGDEITKFVE